MNIIKRYISVISILLLLSLSQLSSASEDLKGERIMINDQELQQKSAKSSGSPWLSSRLLVPHLTVVDVVASKQFYTSAFGFKVRFEDKPGSESQHVEMSYQDELVLMFVPQNVRGSGTAAPIDFIDPKQLTAYFYLYVENVDEAYANAINAGGVSITKPYDSAWGDRFAIVADPNGYHWGLAASPNLSFK